MGNIKIADNSKNSPPSIRRVDIHFITNTIFVERSIVCKFILIYKFVNFKLIIMHIMYLHIGQKVY